MVNPPLGDNLPSPVGTSGRSEASEEDEDVAMETDPSGRYMIVSFLFALQAKADKNETQMLLTCLQSTTSSYTSITRSTSCVDYHCACFRFSRYNHAVGKGRFKRVYKGFDEKQGIDIAWSKIQRQDNQLNDSQIHQIAAEMSIGVDLDHPNVIRCFKCWADKQQNCVNLITEYFTSGNLREFRAAHKHLEPKAVKKWGKQILQGLSYLHDKSPPIVHGDLRCDKIYINGHSGEIKIGDLGLATLLPRRFSPGVLPDGVNKENQYTQHVDIFAFGLCLLELATLKRLDSNNCQIWPDLLETVTHDDAKQLILRCLDPQGVYPSAAQLLQDPFFMRCVSAHTKHAFGTYVKDGPRCIFQMLLTWSPSLLSPQMTAFLQQQTATDCSEVLHAHTVTDQLQPFPCTLLPDFAHTVSAAAKAILVMPAYIYGVANMTACLL